MKKVSLLLVVAFFAALFTVSSCKKDDDKNFSINDNLELNIKSARFYGTLQNFDDLTELYLVLKQNNNPEERHQIAIQKNFSLTLNLAYANYTYYYEYVLKGETEKTSQASFSVVIGRWKTADGGHFEVYNADGTGKMWDPADDVNEDEADTFTWTINESDQTMIQIVTFQSGAGVVPQYCNILKLNENTFNYNNEAMRATYNMIRVN